MGVERSLAKLTIGTGCVVGGLVFPPLLAGQEIVWGTVLATALTSVTAGNTANALDALTAGQEPDRVSLENQDLTKAVGKAIAPNSRVFVAVGQLSPINMIFLGI